jgi:transcription-repair coupling factor (superfamily II helicase)
MYFLSNDNPYRIEFFGDSFDVATQLSLEKQKKITIIPGEQSFQENRESF